MLTEASTKPMKPNTRAKPVRLHDQRHADGKQRADHDHRGDGVGHRHQRRMQRRRHRPDHVVADEDREHENRQPEHGRVDRAAGRRVGHGAQPGRRLVGVGLRRLGGGAGRSGGVLRLLGGLVGRECHV